MDTTPKTPDVRSIPLAELVLSKTPAQLERRRHFDKAALEELAESVKTTGGVLQPIVARPLEGNGKLEVVCGERRVEASRLAGLDSILASVRELSDEQVLEIQLIENLQREDLHELAEAEGYEQLLKRHKYTAQDLAEKVGKSKAYVYARLKLLALGPEARRAFRAGQIPASTALLLARIPIPALQKNALGEVTRQDYHEETMSTREAADHIQENYMLALDGAPFDRSIANLVPGVLPCAECPKNTLRQPELFGDVKHGRAGVCTDPGCFKAKREAGLERKVEAAKARGQEVLEGKKAQAVFPYGTHEARAGYKKLDEMVWTDKGGKKIRQLLGKDVTPVLVRAGDEIIEVVPDSAVKAALREKGESTGRATMGGDDGTARRKKAADRERRFRRALYEQIRAKAPKQLARADLEAVAVAFFREIWNENRKEILRLWGWEEDRRAFQHEAIVRREAPKLSDAELARFLFDCAHVRDLQVGTWSDQPAKALLETAKRLRINPRKIRAELARAKKKPAKASKKKRS